MIEVSYSPSDLEKKWYAKWLDCGLFSKKVDPRRDSYAIVIPPPNVTGILHMGHILNSAIQDVLIRRARQKNKSAVWIPGTDHAGISLQIKVEKELAKQGKFREKIGREEFLSLAEAWRDKHRGIIAEQLKKLGVSCDWSSLKHTLDPDYAQSVLSTFVQLYKQGKIYKGSRFVNWCPVSMTALSDEEVIMREQESRLYHIKYEIVERPGEFLLVATTRPETIMGDMAVAVNPSDERYKGLVGLHCWRPIVREQIPIIADAAVMKNFGTGALKVTPAHDVLDFEIGQRHQLKMVSVIDKNGYLNELAGPGFHGLERFDARKKVAEVLKAQGTLLKEEFYINRVGFSERAGVPIEPMLSEQWFLKYPRVEEAKRAVQERMIRFRPEHWEKTYTHWLDNIKDWCISRQLWWGHRIPVWYKKGADRYDSSNWHVSLTGPVDPENWEQDEDVLDTWFSSAIWPLATFGWPDNEAMQTQGFEYFYPTADLVTAPDIIFFWVARMIMFGLDLRSEDDGTLSEEEIQKHIPFKNVYFTGVIRDSIGRKMSKSLGNSPDPLDLIEKYGADGIRIGLLLMAPSGQDILFSEDRVAQGKKLCTKLWNSFRFRQMSLLEGDRTSAEEIINRIDVNNLESDDIAILWKLITAIREFEGSMDVYEFNRAAQILYTFFWNDYCDWYIETSKSRIDATVLAIHDLILRELLLLFHPFIPFITEELWHVHGYGEGFIGEILIERSDELAAMLGKINLKNAEVLTEEINGIQELVASARSLKAQFGLSSVRDVSFFFKADPVARGIIERHMRTIKYLLGTKNFDYAEEAMELSASVVSLGCIYIDIAKDIDVESEKSRLQKEVAQLKQLIEINEKKLRNEDFLSRAPENVVRGAQELLAENIAKKEELEAVFLKLSLVH